MIKVAVVGCGYWGPNLIRNFVACPKTVLIWACDLEQFRLDKVLLPYPNIQRTTKITDILSDENIDAVCIATPAHTHYPLAKASLEAGKHVLIEKPLSCSYWEGLQLIEIAKEKNLKIMCDHTYCYTPAVRKMKKIIDSGMLGKILYFDSVRINLGLFQHDINVVWDLAPHDLSILDYLLEIEPEYVSTHGMIYAGNDLENLAHITLRYRNHIFAHIHVNWLSPVKIRKTIIAGSEKMLVWDDLDPVAKIKVYDKGVEIKGRDFERKNELLVSYRFGDIYVPHVQNTEALYQVVSEFADSIIEDKVSLTDGESGLRILRVLEASERSIKADGANVRVIQEKEVENDILSKVA